jgi:N-acetylneuraminic acid mutarotase
MIVTGSLTRPRRGPRAAAAAGLLGLAVTLLLAGSGSAAAATGSWTLTGSMSATRSQATATLLQNGEVLVAGGNSTSNGVLASAEIYNPSTGTWAPTGSMTTARYTQVATPLQNGEVLVAGGEGDGGALLGTAEVYNPATGTWAATGPLASAFGAGATATLLPNGTVLVAGGCCTPAVGPGALASAQIYNPATNSWTGTGSMSIGRYYATATLLGNGTVLVVGGDNIVPNMMSGMGDEPLTSAEIYNPATGSWQSAGNTATGHVHATASLLPSGQVLVVGGAASGCCVAVTGADLYTPSTGTWQAAANMNIAREYAAAVVLPDGTVLMTGGYNGNTILSWLASTEIYQPSTNTWTAGPSMNAERAYQTATLLPNGQVLVAGGTDGSNFALASAELYSSGTTSPPAPVVTGVSPSTGPAAGGTAVTVSGSNLTGGSVTFGTAAATGVSCSATSCTATSPAGTGTVNVTVTTASGASATSSADQFTYTAAPPPAPTVTKVSPASGPAAGGTAVTVSGSNLTGGSVTFGTAAATGVSCSATSCTATSPAGTGTVNVTVSTASGTSATSSADQFTYTAAPPPAPAVTGISPPTGPPAGGTAVTVTGANLTGGSVAFGTAAATGVSCSATSCSATSPAGTGTVNVTVSTASGTSATSSADQFTYTSAPPPANLIPDPGFETAAVPADYWGSTVALSQAVVHSGSWSLAQTLQSSSGGWDLDSNPSWCVPISSSKTYTAGVWVRSTATVKVNLSLDLLDSGFNYVDADTGPNVTLVANTWTHLTVTGIKPASGEVYGGMEPDFLSGARGTIIYWDDMTLTSP